MRHRMLLSKMAQRMVIATVCVAAGSAGRLTAGEWHIESLDAGVQAKYTSMKADSDGNLHVVYAINDQNKYPLRYGFWDHKLKRWFVMTVAEMVGTCSLTLDSKSRPHISYTDFAGGRLHYAKWDGAKWNSQVVPINAVSINYYQSIAMIADDRPMISFYEYQGAKDTDFRIRMRVVAWTGQVWELRTVDSDPGSGKFNALTVDPQGHMHLAYANVSAGTGGMRYGYWDGKEWNLEILEGEKENQGRGVGWSCFLVLDKQMNPHFTYMNESAGLVKYAVRRNGKWQLQVIDKVLGIGYPDRNSIALDDKERVYIGFYDAGRGTLKVIHQEGQKWVSEIVDGAYAGFTSSMQIVNGVIWISYGDDKGGGLKVAWREIGSDGNADGKPSAQINDIFKAR